MKASFDSSKTHGRSVGDRKVRMYMQDNENPFMYQPEDYSGNRFFGQQNTVSGLANNLFTERRQKYHQYYANQLQAEHELQARPACFDKCVTDVTSGLDSVEKNCIRDCYLKRVSMRDDWAMYMSQQQAVAASKDARERTV